MLTLMEKEKIKEMYRDDYVVAGRCFDFQSRMAKGTIKEDYKFLKAIEKYLNRELKIKGFIFLNEAYEKLGLPSTSMGCVVGWLKNSEISFSIDNYKNSDALDTQWSIFVMFNIDGIISDKIEKM
jgi:Family of unknown function (DUF6353)